MAEKAALARCFSSCRELAKCWGGGGLLEVTMDIDIELGAPGDPLGPVRQALERRGLRLSKSVIADLRSGKRKPVRTAYRLGCVDRLRANDAGLKTECCLRVLAVGHQHRQASDQPPRVYATAGLTRAMRAALGGDAVPERGAQGARAWTVRIFLPAAGSRRRATQGGSEGAKPPGGSSCR